MSEGKELAIEFIEVLMEEVSRLQIIPLENSYIWDNKDLEEELSNIRNVVKSIEEKGSKDVTQSKK